MRARIIFLLAVSGIFTRANCQDPFFYKWGVKLDADKSLYSARIVASDSKSICIIKDRLNSSQLAMPYSLERFDMRDLELKKTLLLNIKEGKEKLFPEQVVQLKNSLFLFYSTTDRSEKINLYVRELDIATLEPGEGRKIGEMSGGKSGIPKGRFTCRLSPDASRLLLMRNISQRGDKIETVWMTMLDGEAQKRWEKVVSLPFKPGTYQVESMRVSADGNCYLLSKKDDKYDLFTIQQNGDSVTRYPIQLDGLQLSSVQIEMNGTSNLYCAGFFSASKGLNAQGVYFINVDVIKKEIKARNLLEFDPRFVFQNLSKQDYQWSKSRSDQGERAELFQTTLDRILIAADGSVFLVGEQRYRYANVQYYYAAAGGNFPQRTSSNRGSIMTNQNRLSTPQPYQLYNSPNALKNYHHVCNDIVVVKLKPDGQVAWAEKVYKSQNTVDDNGFYSSYMLSEMDGGVHFLFNDHPRNVTRSTFERPTDYTGAKGNLVMVSLDASGNQVRQLIHEYADTDITIIPRMSEQVADRVFVLFGQRRLQEQLATLRFR